MRTLGSIGRLLDADIADRGYTRAGSAAPLRIGSGDSARERDGLSLRSRPLAEEPLERHVGAHRPGRLVVLRLGKGEVEQLLPLLPTAPHELVAHAAIDLV